MDFQLGSAATKVENVFVLGSPRSGTTIASSALRSLGYAGSGEGHILHVLHRMAQAIEWHYENEEGWLGKHNWTVDHVEKDWLIAASAAPLLKRYSDIVGSQFWVDKTPGAEAVAAVATYFKILPQARYIFCHRRGIEHVHSYLRRFGDTPAMFEEACATWAYTMLERLLLPTEASPFILDLAHAELVRDPSAISSALCSFLGFDAGAAEGLRSYFQTEFPEQTGSDYLWKPLESLSWSSAQKRRFIEVCGPCMLLAGYWFESPAENDSEIYLADIAEAETQSVNAGYIKRLSGKKFLFHPGLPEETLTTATFRLSTTSPVNYLWISCRVEHLQSAPLLLTVSLTTKGKAEPVVSDEIELTPMRTVLRSWAFPTASDDIQLTLTSRVADPRNPNLFAWLTISQIGAAHLPYDFV